MEILWASNFVIGMSFFFKFLQKQVFVNLKHIYKFTEQMLKTTRNFWKTRMYVSNVLSNLQ